MKHPSTPQPPAMRQEVLDLVAFSVKMGRRREQLAIVQKVELVTMQRELVLLEQLTRGAFDPAVVLSRLEVARIRAQRLGAGGELPLRIVS